MFRRVMDSTLIVKNVQKGRRHLKPQTRSQVSNRGLTHDPADLDADHPNWKTPGTQRR